MNERILVVDDEPDVLVICSRALTESEGRYRVTTASDANQARAYLDEQKFDLLILDIHLPEEDGLSLLRHVREVQPDLPSVLITGYPAVNTVVDAIRLNAQAYLCKPFTVSKLLETVETSLKESKD